MGTGAKEYCTPDWLTTLFLEEILRDYLNDNNIEVTDINVSTLNGIKGNSFASILHRVNFKINKNNEIERFSIIIKEHPKDQSGVVAHKHRLFKREIHVYKEIMPRINELLCSTNDLIKISPICFYTTETPEPFLILEDLRLHNYEMFEKGRLFSLEQALPILEKIAKFHACSVLVANENPGIMDFFEEGPISKNPERQQFLGYFPTNIRCLAEEVAQWKGYEEICEKLYKLEGSILEKGLDLFRSEPNEFRVLNLGDLWISNVMIKCNEQLVPEDIVLLDYQLAYYGSPAIDLNYFIYGSVNENVRKIHYKYMIREYHRHLSQTLIKLDYNGNIPTLKDIHIEIIKKSLHAVIAASCLTPIVFMDSVEVEESEEIIDENDSEISTRKENIRNPKYKAFIQRTLKEFELSGFLD